MPYNPGVQDRRGEIFAAGIMNAANSISRGITDYAEAKKKKDQDKTAATYLGDNPILAKYFKIDPKDPKSAAAGVDALGGGAAAMTILPHLAHQLEQAEAKQQQEAAAVAAQSAALDAKQKDLQAFSDTIIAGGGNATEAQLQQAYVARGRVLDPVTAAGLSKYAKPVPKDPIRLTNLGTDAYGRPVQVVEDTTGNTKMIEPPKDPNDGVPTLLNKLIRERDAFTAAGRTDILPNYDRAIADFGVKYDAFGNKMRDNATPNMSVPPVEPATKEALLAAVKAKQITVEAAKEIVARKGWK